MLVNVDLFDRQTVPAPSRLSLGGLLQHLIDACSLPTSAWKGSTLMSKHSLCKKRCTITHLQPHIGASCSRGPIHRQTECGVFVLPSCIPAGRFHWEATGASKRRLTSTSALSWPSHCKDAWEQNSPWTRKCLESYRTFFAPLSFAVRTLMRSFSTCPFSVHIQTPCVDI